MKDLIYLDNAATTFPKPDRVYDFMVDFYRKQGVNPGRSGYDAALAAEEMVLGTRKLMTRLFNGTDPNHLTFSYNASDALNMVIQGMAAKGDHLITSNVEHNSVLRPLYHLKHDGVIDVTYIRFDEHGYIDPDDVRKAIRPNTKMVVVNHGSNVIGTVQPIAEIGRICRDAGVWLAVDASQTAGVEPIDVAEMNIDIVVFTGHKSLMGPTGIGGGLCGRGRPDPGHPLRRHRRALGAPLPP
jgi:selenocysteine lyase/cysteine desulfurase